ncbi:MAG: hypothetical protein KDD58_14180 [Bdellovibrionales bacterium]|nr:hypothetical protein [Bdellovibrionales bacterium]
MLASRKIISILTVLGVAFTLPVFAETQESDSETTMKMEDVKTKKTKDIDNEITNKKLRAELGSKSKYSMSSLISYYGGAINQPFSKDRPNLSNEPVAPAVRLTGRVSGRYRINPRSSVTAGIGVGIVQPFHEAQENIGHNNYMDKAEVDDPTLGYSYAQKVGDLQVIYSADYTYFTNDRDTAVNKVNDLWLGTTVLGSIGASKKLQVGLAGYVSGAYFDGTSAVVEGVRKDVQAKQADYGVWLYPFVEYVFNDTFNFRTVFRQMQFVHKRNFDDASDLYRYEGDQSVGLGISVSRDIFLYPNFQFSTENLSFKFLGEDFAKQSTVGLNATINMF